MDVVEVVGPITIRVVRSVHRGHDPPDPTTGTVFPTGARRESRY